MELLFDTRCRFTSGISNATVHVIKYRASRVAGAVANCNVMMSHFDMMKARIPYLLQRFRWYGPGEGDWIDASPIAESKT
jgi:hypothetical protein